MKKIHFIAIGGSAMHSLAIALHNKGIQISGSDDAIFEPSKSKLAAANLLPEYLGWEASKITTDIDAVVLGMHAKKDNPELLAAQKLGLQIYSYPELLYHLTKGKTRVVIAGSHGKTTTTAMILHVMRYCDREVDFMIGAPLAGYDNPVQLSDSSDFMVLEGDEYLSSPLDARSKFLWYQPQIALITGIAWDHINVFPTYASYEAPFKEFIDSISAGGVLVYNAEDVKVKALAENTENIIRKQAYSTPEYEIQNGTTRLITDEGPLPLKVFGQHNMSNLAGAQWICQFMGVDPSVFCEAIASFEGASRRLEVLHNSPKAKLYKDFAHAPSKVEATTTAVKSQYPNLRLIACLELHTYSSLDPEFITHYKQSLAAADEAIVFYDPEALRIKNRQVLPPEAIQAAFDHGNLSIFTSPEALHAYLLEQQYANALLLMMSSGNYGQLDWEALKEKFVTASFDG